MNILKYNLYFFIVSKEGEWKEGMPDGFGAFKLANGRVDYEGHFERGKRVSEQAGNSAVTDDVTDDVTDVVADDVTDDVTDVVADDITVDDTPADDTTADSTRIAADHGEL